MVYHCKVSMTFVLEWRHTMPSMCWNLLVLDETRSRGLVHNWLCVFFLTVIIVIRHTQVCLTIDDKWVPSDSPMSRQGLEQDELVAIPLENEGVDVAFTSRHAVGKDEERVGVNVKGQDIECSISLKRLQFDKMTSWPAWTQWTEQNTCIGSWSDLQKRWMCHRLSQRPYIRRHLQLICLEIC